MKRRFAGVWKQTTAIRSAGKRFAVIRRDSVPIISTRRWPVSSGGKTRRRRPPAPNASAASEPISGRSAARKSLCRPREFTLPLAHGWGMICRRRVGAIVAVRGGYYAGARATRTAGRLRAHLSALRRDRIGPWTIPGRTGRSRFMAATCCRGRHRNCLSDQDVGDLRQGREIAEGELLAPDSTIPAGFPRSPPPVRGFHQDRFCFLLLRRRARVSALWAAVGAGVAVS